MGFAWAYSKMELTVYLEYYNHESYQHINTTTIKLVLFPPEPSAFLSAGFPTDKPSLIFFIHVTLFLNKGFSFNWTCQDLSCGKFAGLVPVQHSLKLSLETVRLTLHLRTSSDDGTMAGGGQLNLVSRISPGGSWGRGERGERAMTLLPLPFPTHYLFHSVFSVLLRCCLTLLFKCTQRTINILARSEFKEAATWQFVNHF